MLSKPIVFFIILFLLLFASESVNAQSESIKNGGFETGNLSPWIYVGAALEPPPLIVTDTEAYNGSYSLNIGGFTLCIVKQEFSPPVMADGTLSFWVLIPPVLDPCDPFDPQPCSLGFSLSVEYAGSQQYYNLISQLTGSGWKKIDIPVSQSDEIQAIVFTTAEISPIYIDEISLPSVSSFPWTIFLPSILDKTP